MKRLVLIDGNAILHRAFYALPETLTLKNGTVINAVYGFVSMLLRIVEDLKPDYLICAFDLPKPTFRDELYKDYRAQRPPTPENLVAQVELTKEAVRAFGIPIYEVEGYEADDIIGTLASLASQIPNKSQIQNSKSKTSNLAMETIIVTGDRDLLQLADERVKVYLPVKGLSQAKLYGVAEIEEKYGIKPKQLVDYKALVGDPSDNYPGVKGIGPKTASKLIRQFTTLEKLYTSINNFDKNSDIVKNVNKNLIDALIKYKEDALMAKKLAKIVTDVPVKLDIDKAKLGNLANSKVERLFKKLAFKTLWKRVEQISKATPLLL